MRDRSPVPGLSPERCALIAWADQAGKRIRFEFVEQFVYFGSGAEHRVYHDERSNLAIKALLHGKFGHFVHAEGLSATPFEYLSRLGWHNLIFGDDIRIVGVAYDGEGMSR